jgi:hypothetical protein
MADLSKQITNSCVTLTKKYESIYGRSPVFSATSTTRQVTFWNGFDAYCPSKEAKRIQSIRKIVGQYMAFIQEVRWRLYWSFHGHPVEATENSNTISFIHTLSTESNIFAVIR